MNKMTRGRFCLVAIGPDGRPACLAYGENTSVYTWADSAARLFAGADPAAKITTMYVEFANVSSPSSTIAVPTINRADGLSYYLDLAADPQRDYVRVPLIGPPTTGQDPTYAGTAYLTASQVNMISAFAVTSGSQGANGKPFSNAANSLITGVALVAAPVPSDRTQDVVCFRGYFATNKQVILPPSGSVMVPYSVTFP